MKPGDEHDVAFTLFEDEDRVIERAETILDGLDQTTQLIKSLTKAYRRAVREQKRMVRLCDRAQAELLAVTDRLEKEVKARAELAEQFRILATTDTLTGVFVRGHFQDLFSHELRARSRTREPLTIALLDVDKFKSVNDTYGHAAGDKALRTLCETLRANLRQGDTVARWGGEEFAIMMPRTNYTNGNALTERLRIAIAAQSIRDNRSEFFISASFGVCTLEGPNPEPVNGIEPIDMLFHHADKALYRAKTTGRNQVIATVLKVAEPGHDGTQAVNA